EAERRRLSRELHDCAGQQLAGLGINLDIIKSELPAASSEAVRTRIEYCKTCVQDMVDWMRGALDDLRPTLLDSVGLVPALQKFALDLPRLAGVEAMIEVKGDPAPAGHDADLAIFRIVQESLINVSRHSKVPNAVVTMDYRTASVRVTIEDLGRGFDPQQDRRARPRGFG